MPIERICILLGHLSVRITEKHYVAWVRARQEQLGAHVRQSWARESNAPNSGFGTRIRHTEKNRLVN
jgi:hypothetical protein